LLEETSAMRKRTGLVSILMAGALLAPLLTAEPAKAWRGGWGGWHGGWHGWRGGWGWRGAWGGWRGGWGYRPWGWGWGYRYRPIVYAVPRPVYVAPAPVVYHPVYHATYHAPACTCSCSCIPAH